MKKWSLLIIPVILSLSCSKEEPVAPEIQGKRVYIVNNLSETVSIYDEVNDTLYEDIFETGTTPNEIYIDHGMAFIVNSGFGGTPSIQILDLSTDEILKEIPLSEGSNPWSITRSNSHYFVTLSARNMVYVYDLNFNLVDSVKTGNWPEGIIYSAGKIFVAVTGLKPDYTYGDGYVYVLQNPDDSIVVDSIKVKTNPQDFCFSGDSALYVVCTGDYANEDGWVTVLNPYTLELVDSIHTGGYPGDIAFCNGKIFLTDWFTGIIIYDTETGVDTVVSTGTGTSRVVSFKDKLYVTIFSSNSINYLKIINASSLEIEKEINLGDSKGSQALAVYEE